MDEFPCSNDGASNFYDTVRSSARVDWKWCTSTRCNMKLEIVQSDLREKFWTNNGKLISYFKLFIIICSFYKKWGNWLYQFIFNEEYIFAILPLIRVTKIYVVEVQCTYCTCVRDLINMLSARQSAWGREICNPRRVSFILI